MNTWIDLVPEKWFEFKHTISAHPFCHECDIYGEKQWALHDEYPAVLIDAPWPVFKKCGHEWGHSHFYKYSSCRSDTCNWQWHKLVEVND